MRWVDRLIVGDRCVDGLRCCVVAAAGVVVLFVVVVVVVGAVALLMLSIFIGKGPSL
jgi:hypothetical protein